MDEKTVFCFYKFRFTEQLKSAENRICARGGTGRRVGFGQSYYREIGICEVIIMGKELSQMSLEELWDLFPIALVAHNDKWDLFYAEIETNLKSILSDCRIERISHIGSTAISGIWAKNIVDVLIEVSKDSDIEDIAKVVENNGFIRMSASAGRISFNRGYTAKGFADKVFHVHIRYVGDNDELYFRDYLNEHEQIAKEYEVLKLQLWKQFEHDRDAYTNSKTEFVMKWTSEAKKIYNGRY